MSDILEDKRWRQLIERISIENIYNIEFESIWEEIIDILNVTLWEIKIEIIKNGSISNELMAEFSEKIIEVIQKLSSQYITFGKMINSNTSKSFSTEILYFNKPLKNVVFSLNFFMVNKVLKDFIVNKVLKDFIVASAVLINKEINKPNIF